MRGAKIGGLSAKLTTKATFTADQLSYSADQLHVRHPSHRMDIGILPVELFEAVRMAEDGLPERVQVSIDRTAQGNVVFQDLAVRDTLIGEALVLADSEFAALIQGDRALPADAPDHPDEVKRQLLSDPDSAYSTLADDWPAEPISWPIIRLSTNMRSPGKVALKFEPEATFMVDGVGVEPARSERKTAEAPYKGLQKHITKRPLAYRRALQAVDHASELTLALTVLRQACAAPGRCRGLIDAAFPSRDEANVEKETDRVLEHHRVLNQGVQRKDVDREPTRKANRIAWLDRLTADFTPSNSAKGWGRGYDLVDASLVNLVRLSFDHSRTPADEMRIVAMVERVAPQFTDFPIPDEPELHVAAASVHLMLGDDERGLAHVQRAIELSVHQPGHRILALKTVALSATFIGDKTEQKVLLNKVEALTNEARRETYDQADEYVDACLSSRSCSSKDLRDWEFDLHRLGTMKKGSISNRDEPYLQGRLTYLIGDQELRRRNRPAARNRLRMLSHDVASAEQEANRTHLGRLRATLQAALGQ